MTQSVAYPVAADFAASSDLAWRTLVSGVLKGAPFERLVGRSADGLAIQPLYATPATPGARAVRAIPGPWAVCQRVDHPDAAPAQALAMADLEGGADVLNLVFAGSRVAYGFGLQASSVDALDEALAGVELDLISLRADAPGSGVAQARLLAALVDKRRLVASTLKIDFGCDPVGAALVAGSVDGAPVGFGTDVAALAIELRERQFGGSILLADGRPVHDAGGTEAQELAHVLASALFYLRLLERHGFAPGQARCMIGFALTADADQFLGIAKFRALRQLWARVEQACGLTPRPIRLHAQTAWRMLARRDPSVNVLRTSMAVFAAGIGGADSITALPFTSALGLPDAFARRIARNSQLVLLEEAHLGIVADPAAGAGGFEALTLGLCKAAWELLQKTEKAGGILSILQSGTLHQALSNSANVRARAIATRKFPLTGTSEFADLDEAAVAVLAPAPVFQAGGAAALSLRRDSEPFEALREAADGFTRRTGKRPKVFLASLGDPFAAAARTIFAANAFATAGIEAIFGKGIVRGDGSTDMDALATQAALSGAQLGCLCGSDAAYAAEAGAAAKRLASHFRALFLAGKPPAVPLPGLHYLHLGVDIVAALQAAHASLKG